MCPRKLSASDNFKRILGYIGRLFYLTLCINTMVIGYNNHCKYTQILTIYITTVTFGTLGAMMVLTVIIGCIDNYYNTNSCTTNFWMEEIMFPLLAYFSISTFCCGLEPYKFRPTSYILLQVSANIYRIPSTVICIIILFSEQCIYDDVALNKLLIALIVMDILYYSLTIYRFIELERFAYFNIFGCKIYCQYLLVAICLVFMETTTILLCILSNIHFQNETNNYYNYFWIFSIVLSFPLSSIIAILYYINTYIYSNIPLKWSIYNDPYCHGNVMLDRIYCVVHEVCYHSAIKLQVMSCINTSYLSMSHNNAHSLDDKFCVHEQLKYMTMHTVKQKKKYIQHILQNAMM
eukprot:249188_1